MSEQEIKLHEAVCEAVGLMRAAVPFMEQADLFKAQDVLREALIAYADAAVASPTPPAAGGEVGEVVDEIGASGWFIGGPNATAVVYDQAHIEPVIAALCAATGDEAGDYTATWNSSTHPATPVPGDSVRVPRVPTEAMMRAAHENCGPYPSLLDRWHAMLAAAPQQAEPPVAESATTPSDTVSSGIDPLPTAPYPAPQQAGPTCEESLQVQLPVDR